MVTIIQCDYTFVKNRYQSGLAVAFDEDILEVDTPDILEKKYKNARIARGGSGSILYPGFINTHVHLEFSANKTRLKYGDFMQWLHTVIQHRDELVEMADSRRSSLCCGGGGGRIWMETPKSERFSDLRVNQALEAGAQILATSCPYCITNFEDSRITMEYDDVLTVKDITEVILEAIQETEETDKDKA